MIDALKAGAGGAGRGHRDDLKFQILSPKSETNSNHQNSKYKTKNLNSLYIQGCRICF
jgi:hypothetical protein